MEGDFFILDYPFSITFGHLFFKYGLVLTNLV